MVAIATGLIGAVVGVVSLILGVKNHQWIKTQKRYDAKLELRKAVTTTHALAQSVERLRTNALVSRTSLRAALGTAHSGAMQKEAGEAAEDQRIIVEITKGLPDLNDKFAGTDNEGLAEISVSVHKAQELLNGMKTKYEATLLDDKHQQNIIAQMQLRNLS